MTDKRLDEIKTRWNIPVTLPMSVPWGKDDVVWLVQEVTRLRAEAQRADEEATKLANSDLATTEQVVRALRVENDALRARVERNMTSAASRSRGWVGWLMASPSRRRAPSSHAARIAVMFAARMAAEAGMPATEFRDLATDEYALAKGASIDAAVDVVEGMEKP